MVPNLIMSGDEVLCVTKSKIIKKNRYSESFISMNYGLENERFCNYLLDKYRPETIFHLAAVHGSTESGKNFSSFYLESMYKCHVQTTSNILNWMKRVDFSPKLIFPLTSQLFRAHDYPTVIDETAVPAPINLYAQTKLEAWHHIRQARREFDVIVFCPILFSHTSIFAHDQFLLPSMAKKLKIAIKTNSLRVNFLDVVTPISISSAEEIVDAVFRMSKLEKPVDIVIGNSKLTTIAQILSDYARIRTDLRISEIEVVTEQDKVQPYLKPDTTKARELLDWNPIQTPVDILHKIFEFQQ